ncbi:HNH endonuclease signature motif containing protein [Flexivirga meconopsidis]|uniref:HNH endonuclease signature motif containing protein n=1 Tax=Flexivirga meconopsidis TaxID=2977121 RepID=UPI00224084EC|nr:HNH endonuclease signature motif containing protein [Flexivirga meconopsidis]
MSLDSAVSLPDRPEVPDGASRVPVEPGRGPVVLEKLQAVAALLDEVPGVVHQLGDGQLELLTQVLLRLHGRSAQVAAVVTADAVDRGSVAGSTAANTTQWVCRHAATAGVPVEPAEAKSIAVVAEACREPENAVIAAAVRQGSCTVSTARAALTNADKVAPVVPFADRGEVLSWFLQLDPSLGVKGVQALTRKILATFASEALSAQDAKLEQVETLTWGTTATGMTRLVAELAPANAAVVKAAIAAGSAPRPASPGETDGSTPAEPGDTTGAAEPGGSDTSTTVRDDRTPGKRRADALIELVTAGARVAAGEAAPVGSAATILLTMNLKSLTEGIGGATTPAGDVLDAGAARRAACDADLIPAVLGGPSQPLDVGRRERLVTKGLRAAVLIRDGGCTFPGCDRPPGFCEVHHVIPWWAGGETSITNSAMLCCRHHQEVHRRGFTARVRADGVIWDLTDGRMPGHAHSAA